MATKLLIDCGLAMTRAALIRGEEVIQLSALPNENNRTRLLPGMRVIAQLVVVNRAAGTVFLKTKKGHGLFASFNRSWENLPEGAFVEVNVKSQARRHKYVVVEFVRPIAANTEETGNRDQSDCLASILNDLNINTFDAIDAVITTDGISKAGLSNTPTASRFGLGDIEVRPNALHDILFFDQLNGALTPLVDLPGGGALTIDEAEALTAIDVDTYLAKHQSRHALREQVNAQALAVICKQIELRRLGGQFAIDFLPVAKPGRAAFQALVSKKLETFDGFARAGWTPSGLFTFVLPRKRASLLETLTQPKAYFGDGRIFTREVAAGIALCALEDHLRAHPGLSFALDVADDIWRSWQANEKWAIALGQKYGNRFSITHSPNLIETSYVCTQTS